MPTSSGFQVNEILTAANTNQYLLRPYTNAIINGAMNITQRGTSLAGITSGDNIGTADRWLLGLSGAGTWTETTQALTSSDAPVQEGIRNSTKVTCTTANASLSAGAFNIFGQKIEGFNLQQFAKGTTGAKSFALSFWVKSNITGTFIAELFDHTNNRTISSAYTITSSNVWQKVRIVFSADFTGALTNNNSLALSLFLWLGAGSNYSGGTLQSSWAAVTNNKRAVGQVNLAATINNYFEITGVQLEPNSVCTPFEIRTYSDEFASCLRYFQRHTQPSLRGVCAVGFTRMALHYGTPMRSLPTMTSNGGTMGFWDGVTGVSGSIVFTFVYSLGNSTCEADISSSGWTAGRAAVFYQNASHTFVLDLNAEL